MMTTLSSRYLIRPFTRGYLYSCFQPLSSATESTIKAAVRPTDDAEKNKLIEEITTKLCCPQSRPNGERPIAIEVDGPSHFYVNTHKYTAYTKLKHRLLSRMGYKVLHVPYFEWRKLRGAKERENYMRAKLQEEPTEWLEPEDEQLFAERLKAAEDQQNRPSPPKTPRPTRKPNS